MQTTSEAALVKALGVRALTASIVNTTIGAGIFVLPAAVAAGLGAAAPLAYVLCAALMALIVSCFAAAGSSPRDDVNQALGVGHGPRHGGNVEVKYSGPDGVMVDVSETGWVGTSPLPKVARA